MKREIFQKPALERLSSPEQLDQLMPILRPAAWVALIGVGLLLTAAVLWSVFGTIKTVVAGYGSLERLDGVSILRAPASGTLQSLLVQVDDNVEQGQTLAMVAPADPQAAPLPLTSPVDGRVLNVLVAAGQPVGEAQEVLRVEDPRQRLSGVLYISTVDAYQVEVGMEAKLLPATSSKHEGAYLRGRVTMAGRQPVATRQPADWYDQTAARPMLKVVIGFEPADSQAEVYSGTPCQGLITVEERRPIGIIFSGT
jgi:multidrug efflux pump subunit AcrA (membrane-fusion protein)